MDVVIKNGKATLKKGAVYKVTVFECKKCGGEIETDLPLEHFTKEKCSKCGTRGTWEEKRNIGKRIAQDATAPLELIQKDN